MNRSKGKRQKQSATQRLLFEENNKSKCRKLVMLLKVDEGQRDALLFSSFQQRQTKRTALILITVIVILAVYDGKPSPVLGGISLNTIIALAATLFRICLMVPVTDCIGQLTWVWLQKGYKPLHDIVKFDAASRGPIGSLQLLLEFRNK